MNCCGYLVCVLGVALSFGCEPSRGDGGVPESASRSDSVSPQQPLVEGHYVFGNEVNTFSPCASGNVYWVVGAPARMDSLRVAYLDWSRATQADPYAPMLARFDGGLSAGPLDGFAEAYDGLFTVEGVALLREPEEGDCQPLGAPEELHQLNVVSSDAVRVVAPGIHDLA